MIVIVILLISVAVYRLGLAARRRPGPSSRSRDHERRRHRSRRPRRPGGGALQDEPGVGAYASEALTSFLGKNEQLTALSQQLSKATAAAADGAPNNWPQFTYMTADQYGITPPPIFTADVYYP